MSTVGRTIRKATTVEIVKIAGILSKAIKKNRDGTVYYKDGQTDESIAGQIGNGLTVLAVARIRKEMYGNFSTKGPRSGSSGSGLERRIKRIEEYLRPGGYEASLCGSSP